MSSRRRSSAGPALTFVAMLGIAIDHCFATPRVELASRDIGPPLGSDHRPIVVRAVL